MARRRHTIRFLLLVAVPAAALLTGAHYWVKSTRYVATENAYVKAHHLAVSADIDGRAVRVLVDENDRVEKGDLLFELDAEPHRLEIAQAEAEIAGIRNTLDALRAEYRTAQAELAEAEHEIAYFRRVHDRQKELSRRGVASRAAFDEAERNLTKARQTARTVRQKIAQSLARLGGSVEIPAERHPMYLAAVARRDQAQLALRRTRVHAPADGIVGKVSLQPGEYVEEGKAVIPLIQSGETWVEANLKETDLTHIKPGQSVSVTIDAYPDRRWTAKIVSISPTTGAELSVLPPQNASGNWVKVVQRVPVRLEFDRLRGDLPLRAGMTAAIRIDTERDRSLFRMFDSAWASIAGKK